MHQLDKAEAFLVSRPDSALSVLQSVQPQELHSQRLLARHALLTSIALDKNYIDVDNDSLINIAETYYSKKGAVSDKMKSWYYKGLVQKNSCDYTASIVSLEMAEQEAFAIRDYHMLGLIYRNKSDIYRITNNNEASIDFIRKSIDAFQSANDSIYSLHAKYTLAVHLLNNKETSQAYDQLTELLHNHNINSLFRTQINLCIARTFIEEGDSLDKAISIYQKTPERLFHDLDYGLYAIALHNTGQKDSAQFWFDKGYKRYYNRESTASLQYLQSTVANKDKNYQLAFQLLENALHVQDSLTRVLLKQSLSNAQLDYYQAQMLLKEGVVKRQRTGILFGGSIILLGLAISILIWKQKKHRAETAVKEQMAYLSMARNSTIHANAYLVGALIKEKMARLHHLSDDYFQEEDPVKKEKAFIQFKDTLREIRGDNVFFDSLEADLNKYCNGIMEKLASQVPQIKGSNRKLIALLFSDLPSEWIQVLGYRNSYGSIKTARSRIRDMIKEAHAEDETLFLEMLESSKRSKKIPGPSRSNGRNRA